MTEIHPSIRQINLLGCLIFLWGQLAACKPNLSSGWRRAAMMLFVGLLGIALGGGGGKDDGKNTSSVRQLFISTPNF